MTTTTTTTTNHLFYDEFTFLVLGGSGGLGREVARLVPNASNWSLDTGVDLTNDDSVTRAVVALTRPVSGIVNCAGINRLAKFDDVTWEGFSEVMNVNAFALVRVVQALRKWEANFGRPGLLKGSPICNVVSNAAAIPMRASLAYGASKAAAQLITRQMARELPEYISFCVNPNKLNSTKMSKQIESEVQRLRGWTADEAARYQLAALPAGVETPPASVAAFICHLLNPINLPYIQGCYFPYGGPQG
jgi:NAD(P)-dependent dehydrogenase (short-subunit alcohol dehydrogenase family)